MQKKTIVITGGHHNSALVVAQALQKTGFEVVWFGHRYAAHGDTQDSAEYEEVMRSKITFYTLKAGKLSSPPRLSEIVKIPLGCIQALWLLIKNRPAAVISFGGYLGLSTAIPAFLLRIPLYLHEQTIIAGRANLLAARLARKIFVTWNSSLRFFSSHKTHVIGLPLRSALLQAKSRRLFENTRPTLLILGGKQGSHIINQAIFAALPELTKKYNLIHQTGTSSVTGDYVQALRYKTSQYRPYGYIGEEKMGEYLASVDVVISRSGAHTAYELAILGKRSILIPFMATTGHEQYEQARLLQAAGIATILLESELTPTILLTTIKEQLALPTPTPLSLPRNAATLLVNDLIMDLG